MRSLLLLSIAAFGLFSAGCGGSNSSSGQHAVTTVAGPSILSISKYALPAGTSEYAAYITAVDDSGVSYGSLGPTPMGTQAPASPAAYWPTPSSYVTVPVLDSKVYSETLAGRSLAGAILIGYTYDADNSEGPGRGFAYDPVTHQFHVLAITVSGGSQLFVNPQSVSDAGVVSGYVTFRTSTGQGGSNQFTYNLSDDTFQLANNDNAYQNTVNGHQVSAWSQNRQYFGTTWAPYNTPVIYYSSTDSPMSVESSEPGYLIDYLSNDASIAVIGAASITAGTNAYFDATIWFPGRGTVSTYNLLMQSEPGVFNGTVMLVGSPLGHYVTIGNSSEGGNLTRLVHVK